MLSSLLTLFSLVLISHFGETLVRNKMLEQNKPMIQNLLFHLVQVMVLGLASFFWHLWHGIQIQEFCFGLR